MLRRYAQTDNVFVPCIVIGELQYGACGSGNPAKNLQRVAEFVDASVVLECDLDTTEHCGIIRNELRVKERPIPENDIWIAAVARQHLLTIATCDKHVLAVDEESHEFW